MSRDTYSLTKSTTSSSVFECFRKQKKYLILWISNFFISLFLYKFYALLHTVYKQIILNFFVTRDIRILYRLFKTYFAYGIFFTKFFLYLAFLNWHFPKIQNWLKQCGSSPLLSYKRECTTIKCIIELYQTAVYQHLSLTFP